MPDIRQPLSPEVQKCLTDARHYITQACNGNPSHYYRIAKHRAEELKASYPSYYNRVLLFQMLIGGTPQFPIHDIIDFPSPDSVLEYLKSLALQLEYKAPP